jgi:hypothetical protein
MISIDQFHQFLSPADGILFNKYRGNFSDTFPNNVTAYDLPSNSFFCINLKSLYSIQYLSIWMNIQGRDLRITGNAFPFTSSEGVFLSPSYGVIIFLNLVNLWK